MLLHPNVLSMNEERSCRWKPAVAAAREAPACSWVRVAAPVAVWGGGHSTTWQARSLLRETQSNRLTGANSTCYIPSSCLCVCACLGLHSFSSTTNRPPRASNRHTRGPGAFLFGRAPHVSGGWNVSSRGVVLSGSGSRELFVRKPEREVATNQKESQPTTPQKVAGHSQWHAALNRSERHPKNDTRRHCCRSTTNTCTGSVLSRGQTVSPEETTHAARTSSMLPGWRHIVVSGGSRQEPLLLPAAAAGFADVSSPLLLPLLLWRGAAAAVSLCRQLQLMLSRTWQGLSPCGRRP